jgi:hypothetical protein
MRTIIGSSNRQYWCYNMMGSVPILWMVPTDVGTTVLFTSGTDYIYYNATLATRTKEYVLKTANFTSSTLWSRFDVQSGWRINSVPSGVQNAFVGYPELQSGGTTFNLRISASIYAPALTDEFRGKYFYGMDGSNYYTRFVGLTHAMVEDKRYEATVWGTIVATLYNQLEAFATIIFRGTNNSPYSLSPRRIVLFGSFSGTAAKNATVAYVTKGACEEQGGNVTLTAGNWDDLGAGDVWAGTFIINPFFGTFRYNIKEVEVSTEV